VETQADYNRASTAKKIETKRKIGRQRISYLGRQRKIFFLVDLIVIIFRKVVCWVQIQICSKKVK